MAHELMHPGNSVQSCVLGDVDYIMSHQLNMELDRYGYQEIKMEGGLAFPDGTCLLRHGWDTAKTVEKVKRFSEKDAKKMIKLAGFLRSAKKHIIIMVRG